MATLTHTRGDTLPLTLALPDDASAATLQVHTLTACVEITGSLSGGSASFAPAALDALMPGRVYRTTARITREGMTQTINSFALLILEGCGVAPPAPSGIVLSGALVEAGADVASGSASVGISLSGAMTEGGGDTASGSLSIVAPGAITLSAALTEAGADTASGEMTVGALGPTIGGVSIGTQGATGTIYDGYVLADGDDFDASPDFLTPTDHDGAYMTTRHYGVQSGDPRYLRGAASLGGYEADPWHTGFGDAGRGVVPAGFADTITVGNSALKLKSRRATPAEKTLMGPLSSKGNLSSMVHMARRNMMRAPCIMEMRLRFPRALSSWDQWHPTFWLLQSQPGNGWDGLELDCEGFGPALDFSRHAWVNGTPVYSTLNIKTAPVSATEYRTYGFEIAEVEGVWRTRLWEDGALVGDVIADVPGRPFDATRPFHLMITNHILQSGLNQSVFDAAGDAGADIECDWWRTWQPVGKPFRKPLQGPVELLTDFGAPFNFSLSTPQEVWGPDVSSDVIEMIPNEDNTPAQPWVRGLLPPSVTRTGNTLAGTISDHAGRLVLARSATPSAGDGCAPQPITICVGPRISVSSLGCIVGEPFTFDAYAAVDCGDLHMGKSVTVSGLPSWASFDAGTGLVTGTPTATGSANITITGINAMGQAKTATIPLSVSAEPVAASEDTFNTASETPLVDYVGESGAPWQMVLGSGVGGTVRNGRLASSISAPASSRMYTRNIDLPDDQFAEAVMRRSTADGTKVSIALRVSGNNAYYAHYELQSNEWQLYKSVSGTPSLIKKIVNNVAGFSEATHTATVRLEAQGSALRLLVNGVEILTATDTSLKSGRAGVRTYTSTNGGIGLELDNFIAGPLT